MRPNQLHCPCVCVCAHTFCYFTAAVENTHPAFELQLSLCIVDKDASASPLRPTKHQVKAHTFVRNFVMKDVFKRKEMWICWIFFLSLMMISASECSRKKEHTFFTVHRGANRHISSRLCRLHAELKVEQQKKQLSTRPAPPANPDSAQPLHLPWRYLKKKENQRWSSQRLSWKPAEET